MKRLIPLPTPPHKHKPSQAHSFAPVLVVEDVLVDEGGEHILTRSQLGLEAVQGLLPLHNKDMNGRGLNTCKQTVLSRQGQVSVWLGIGDLLL